MTPDPSAFAEPCAITAGAFCLTHRASTTDPRSEECVAMTLHDEAKRLRAGIEGIKAKALDHRKIITEGPLVGRILVSHWCDSALLDPTEGETDE